MMKPAPERLLFIAASGIGNTILATPLIQRTRERWPRARIDLLTSRRVFQAPLTHAGIIDGFHDLERSPMRTLLRLRRARYDASITCFPSNRWQFNVVAAVIAARLRVTHAYEEGNRLGSLVNALVRADESLHDVEQNLNLLTALSDAFGTTDAAEPPPPPIFALRPADERRADEWLRGRGLDGRELVGVHVGGSSPARPHPLMNRPLGAIKAPPRESLRADLMQRPDARILFLGGSEEEAAISSFRETLPPAVAARCDRYCGDLWTTAALVRRCSWFVSGDTALMHIAAVFGVPQKAYFMASNPARTAPRNARAQVVIAPGCDGYRYPFRLSEDR